MTENEIRELRQVAAHIQSYKKNVDALAEAWKQDRDRVFDLTGRLAATQAAVAQQTSQIQQLQQLVAQLQATSRGRGSTT